MLVHLMGAARLDRFEPHAAGKLSSRSSVERTGLGIDAVRNARKRIKRRAFELFAEDEKEGPQR